MTPEQIRTLKASSVLAWVTLNGMVNENQRRVEFERHRCLIDVYEDFHHDIVCRKSAQVGFSTKAIFKAGHTCAFKKLNVIYVLPTQNIVKDFVFPKVDPLIQSNPEFAKLVTKDSQSLKQVGDRFLYFKGAASEREAIAISGDVLILDEYDRMPDMNIVNTYDSRLQASDAGWRWRFSNPSGVGFGTDALYNDSDQRHWFIRCSSCNYEWYIDFEPGDDKRHYLDREQVAYVCGNCKRTLSDTDRQNGRWVRKYNDRDRHGYWINQLMMPYVSARRILEQYEESTVDFFNNFVLGKAYTPTDLIVNRETILRACAPSQIQKRNVVMGVDQEADGQFYVLMTPQGVFSYGKTKSWEELEHIKLMYQAIVVCDPNPYSTVPKQMADKYSDWYLCYFKESTTLDILQWKGSVVYADRTRLLDTVAKEIADAKILFRQRPMELEAYITDWQNLYRTTEEKEDGRIKSTWMKKEGRNSDFSFATAYARVALTRILLSGNSQIVEPELATKAPVTDTIDEHGRYATTLTQSVAETFAELDD